VPAFVVAEAIGGAIAWAIVKVLYPGVTATEAAEVVVPHHLLDGAQASHQTNQPSSSPSR
jgi:hypothetical protein